MTWALTSDDWWRHPKTIGMPLSVRGLWSAAQSWCMDQLSDGKVPTETIKMLGGTKAQAAELVKRGLWEEVPGGYVFHDWHDANPTVESIMLKRAKGSARAAASYKRRFGKSSDESSGEESGEDTAKIQRTFAHSSPPPIPIPNSHTQSDSTVAAAVPTPRLAAAGPPEPAAAAAADRGDLLWFCALAERLSRGEIEPSTLLRRGPHHDAAEALFVMAERAAKRRSIGTRQLVEAVFSRWLTPERARIRKGWIVALHDDWPAQLLELDDEIQRQAVLAGDAVNA